MNMVVIRTMVGRRGGREMLLIHHEGAGEALFRRWWIKEAMILKINRILGAGA